MLLCFALLTVIEELFLFPIRKETNEVMQIMSKVGQIEIWIFYSLFLLKLVCARNQHHEQAKLLYSAVFQRQGQKFGAWSVNIS